MVKITDAREDEKEGYALRSCLACDQVNVASSVPVMLQGYFVGSTGHLSGRQSISGCTAFVVVAFISASVDCVESGVILDPFAASTMSIYLSSPNVALHRVHHQEGVKKSLAAPTFQNRSVNSTLRMAHNDSMITTSSSTSRPVERGISA